MVQPDPMKKTDLKVPEIARMFAPYFVMLKPVKWHFIGALIFGAICSAANGFGFPFLLYKVLPKIFGDETPDKWMLIGAVLLAAAWGLWTGRRWARGIAIYAQMLLLPVSWYIGVGSGQWRYGVPVALMSVTILVLLFSRSALQWLTSGGTAASSDSSGPVTR